MTVYIVIFLTYMKKVMMLLPVDFLWLFPTANEVAPSAGGGFRWACRLDVVSGGPLHELDELSEDSAHAR